MAKFKKGDRFRFKNSTSWNGTGIILGNSGQSGGAGVIYLVDMDESKSSDTYGSYQYNGRKCSGVAEDYIELLTPQYTPISPKIGEKYRVLKRLKGVADIGDYFPTGRTLEIMRVNDVWGDQGNTHKAIVPGDKVGWQILEECFTTEYLELVSEPAQEKVAETIVYDHKVNMQQLINAMTGHCEPKPINQSIIKKTMNLIKKALLSKDDKNLIKAGYMDENMNLTSRGREALEFITFTENKAKLVEMAEAQIAEDKE